MNNSYSNTIETVLKLPLRLMVLLLLILPFAGQAQTFTVTPSDPVNPQEFGMVATGTSSASKSYNVQGSGFAPGTTVGLALDGSQFEISRNNTSFANAAVDLPADNSGVISTTVYARFSPTVTGIRTRTLKFSSDAAPDVFTYTLRGTGVVGSPSITASPPALAFGDNEVGSTSAAMDISVDASSLTAAITVTAPSGFQVSYSGSPYATTATIAPVNGSVIGATVSVIFKPTAAQNYVGSVTFASTSATTQSVGVSGTGTVAAPILTVDMTALDFGTTTVGLATASQPFTVSGSNLQGQGNVTIAAPTGFQIRTGTNFFSASPITLSPVNGILASTTIDVRFVPNTVGSYSANVVVSTPSGSSALTRNVAVSGTANASSGVATLTANPGSVDFGTVTSSGSANVQSFEVSGTDLTANAVLTPSSNTIQLRNATLGGVFSSSPLTVVKSNGTISPQVIEVRLVPTIAAGAYSKSIDITSGTAATQVSVTAQNTSGATSDISVSNPNGNNFTFVTRPNTISPVQSFLVAGTNLVQPLVVEATGPNAAYFQVSSDNVNFFSSLSFTPNGQGNVIQRPIYARFIPGNNAITVTGTIRNSSAPAPAFDVSITGISEPTIRLDRPIGAFATNVVKNTVTAPVTVRLEGFLLDGQVQLRFPADLDDVTRNPSKTPLFEFSLNGGATYVKSANITPDADGNFATDLLVRYAPVRVGAADQTLQFRNASFFNNTFYTLASGSGRATGFSIAVEPTAQSTAIVTHSADGRSVTITYDLSSPPASTSYGVNRLVIGSSSYITLPPNIFPRDKQNFNPGTTNASGEYNYGTGTSIQPATNTFVVFSGANNSFVINGLDPALTYNFFSFEFNNDGVLNAENYLVPNNQPRNPLPVELLSFTAKLHNGTVALNWATASERNSNYFEVQRSLNGQTFATILGRTPARGTSSQPTAYSAIDASYPAGTLYYRLRQVDLDGTWTYSPVAIVNTTERVAATVLLYPNPTSDVLHVETPAATPYRVLNLLGQSLMTGTTPAEGTPLDVRALPAGAYLLELGTAQGRQVSKFVKE